MIQLANFEERTFYVMLGKVVTSVDVTFTFQMTEEEFTATLIPVRSSLRATEFTFQATGYPEGQYIVEFVETGRPAGDITVLATVAGFVSGNPIFATSQYNTYNDDGTSTTYVPSDDQGLVPSVSQKLRVSTVNQSTDVSYVRYIKVTNGTLTDNGDNSVTIDTGGAESLTDLGDVLITGFPANQILRFDAIAAKWKNVVLSLDALSDTKGTPVEGKYLKYTGGFWQPADVAATLGQLTDVDTTGQVTGYVLVSNGANWSAQSLPIINGVNTTRSLVPSSGITKIDLNPNISLTSVTADSFKATGDMIIQIDSDNNQSGRTLTIVDGASNERFKVDESGNVTINGAYKLPLADGTANQLLKTDGADTLSFGANLQDLDNVATLTPGPGQVLTWVGSEWQPSSPTSPPPDTNLANTNLTQTGNRTFDHGGLTLTFDLNDGGEFIVTDSSDPAFGDSLKCGSGTLKIHNIFYPDTDGTAGQVMTTDGAGTLSFTSLTQYHDRYATEAETLRAGATATVELYYTAQADGDGYAESASSDTATAGYDIRRKLYYSEAAQADPDTGTWVQFATIADDTTFASAKATLLAYLKERTGGTVPISLKMTWEEVLEPAFLLDTYTGAAAAYSLRQLRTAYTGDAIRVRRASDNTEQDIGFDGSGGLDTTSLASFCSGTNGFVKTWYDQSGNANDATQSTTANQPKIYDSSTGVVTENGKPAVEFDGSNDFLSAGTGHDFTTSSFFAVYKNSTDAAQLFGAQTANDNGWRFQGGASDARLRVQGVNVDLTGVPDTSTGSAVLRAAVISGGTVDSYLDSTNSASGSSTMSTTTSFDFRLGTVFAQTLNLTGIAQEFVWYDSDQSSNRTNIESNINTFYSIY